MSEYQRLKARAQALQREKEEELKRELEAKAARDKQAQKEEAERRKRIEDASKEARRKELMAANAALNKVPNAGAKSIEYDPFAEDAVGPSRPPPKKTSTSSTTRNGNGPAPRRGPAAVSGSSKANGTGTKRETGGGSRKAAETPVMGRKEKAALKLARQAKSDSMFSVASLVDMAEGTSSRSVSPPPRRAPPQPSRWGPPPRRGPAAAGAKRSVSAASSAPGARGMAGLKKSVDVSDLRKLCPDRSTRDRRTIDEIQRDIRLRRDGASGANTPPSKSGARDRDGARDTIRARDHQRERDMPRERDRNPDRDRGLGRDRDRRPVPVAGAGAKARRRSPSTDSDDSDSGRSTPPRKKRALGGPDFDGDAPHSRAAVSAIIQGMFNRGRAPRVYHDDSDGSDMEAGLNDVEAEERRALKIARREDEAAEREEAERRAAKERLRREREKRARA